MRRRQRSAQRLGSAPRGFLVAVLVIVFLIAHAGEYSVAKELFNTPGAVMTLRRYWKDKINLPPPENVATEFLNESDRACVMLAATILDDSLTHLISKRLTVVDQDQLDYIFRF
jgi:hypothetical protein